MWTIRLLGPPRFRREDKDLLFPFRKAEALACYLAVERRASREVLAELFWGDRNDEAAFRNLRNALYELRKHLSSRLLRTDRQWIVLDLDHDDVDLDLEVLSRWRVLPLMELGALSRPFLEGFVLSGCPSFEEWLERTRARFRDVCHEALKGRARMEMEREETSAPGDLEKILRLLEMLRGEEPLDEEVTRLLLTCHFLAGRRGKAVEVYRLLRERLQEELGVLPSEETEALYRHLLGGVVGAVARSPSSRTEAVPFFGRVQDLAALEAACAGRSSRPRCLLVCGEAGVGKTLLLSKFFEERRGALVLSGWGASGEGRYALLPWNDLLGELRSSGWFKAREIAAAHRSLLGASFPALRMGGSVAAEPVSPARIGAILADAFGRIAARRELFLRLEDVQWFDETSLELLESLLLHLFHRSEGITFFFTARPDPAGRCEALLKALARMGRIELHRIELGSFTRGDMEGFCRAYLPSRRFSEEELEKLFLQTEGLPLFLAELLRRLGEGYSADGGPESLAAVIEGILSGVSEDERALLDALSVFPGRAEWELLRRFAGFAEEALTEMLERLRRMALLVEREEDGRKLFVDFRHFKVKEHLCNALSAGRRRLLHRRMAELLIEDMDRRGWDDLLCSRVLGHCRAADMRLEELELTVRKLRLHIKLHYELFPLLDDAFLRSASTISGGRNRTMEELREVRALLAAMRQEQGDSEKLAELEMAYRILWGGYLLWWGEYDRGERMVRAVSDKVVVSEKWHLALEALQHLCYYGIQIEDGEALGCSAETLRKVALRREDAPAEAMALRFLGLAAFFRRDFAAAVPLLESSIALFEDVELAGRTFTLQKTAALNYLGAVEHHCGRFEEAVRIYEECAARCEKEGMLRGGCLFHSNAAHAAYDRGDRTLMARHLQSARGVFEDCLWWRGNAVCFSLTALLAGEEGDEEEALAFLRKADALCIPLRKRQWLALQLWVKGLLKRRARPGGPLESALPESAEEYFLRAGELYRRMGVRYMVERIERALAERRCEEGSP